MDGMRNDENREINNHGELIKIEAIREEGEEKNPQPRIAFVDEMMVWGSNQN